MRPRIRSVKPEMRQDERYARLSYPARELFNGLITMADDEGRFRALTSAIIGHVFPYDEDAPRKIRGWVAEVKQSGMVLFYMADDTPYGAFRHWARHQKINRPSPSQLPPPPDPQVIDENAVVETEKGWRQALALTDRSGSTHDSFSESSRNVHSLTRACAFRSDPIGVREELFGDDCEVDVGARIRLLSELLAAHIVTNDPKAKAAPFSDRWLTDMRLLVADRGGDWREVADVIGWCQRDAFWRSNILSATKLRKQFTQLVLKARQPDAPGRRVRESPSDLLRAINGEAA